MFLFLQGGGIIPAAAQTSEVSPLSFPEIKIFSPNRDSHFQQLSQEIQYYYQCAAAGRPLPDLLFFTYTTDEDDTLYTLAAALGLPYDTLATVNRIRQPGPLEKGRTLLIPSQPGLALYESPRNDWEHLLHSRRLPPDTHTLTIHLSGVNPFRFYPGLALSPTERSFFLELFFRFPLEKGFLTSSFGYRADPFTGDTHFHKGIDLAAPEGTAVLAAQEGKITEVSCNPVLGNYIIMEHPGGYFTLYGHLKQIYRSVNEKISRGGSLGTVGMTGRTTGPHLHFEIRQGDISRDPEDYLR